MQRFEICLWLDTQAEEMAQFYTSIFKNSKIGDTTHYPKAGFEIHHKPEGSVLTVQFELEGQRFLALNGGPEFKFNPSISFLVACDTKEEVEELWHKLSPGGSVMMPLGQYPFSEKYGWTTDKFGLSWQVMLYTQPHLKNKIVPTLMFVGDVYGKAEEAVNMYTSVFHNSEIDHIMRYEEGDAPDKPGTVRHIGFEIENQVFAAMDSARGHTFAFNEAISFIIRCETQEEIGYYWNKLTADPKAEACGWLKDKFGVSWQVTPIVLEKMLLDPDNAKIERIFISFMKMKKIDIATIQKAYDGK